MLKAIVDVDSRKYLGFDHLGDRAKVAFQYLSYLLKIVWTVDQMTELNKIFLKFCPPSNMEGLDESKDVGVDTVGIHIESFDLESLVQVAPPKADIGLTGKGGVDREVEHYQVIFTRLHPSDPLSQAHLQVKLLTRSDRHRVKEKVVNLAVQVVKMRPEVIFVD